jgi:hypothetical protein
VIKLLKTKEVFRLVPLGLVVSKVEDTKVEGSSKSNKTKDKRVRP